MFHHVVFMKFIDLDNRAEAARRLQGLVDTVPSLRSVQTGVDVLQTDRSWDLCLITRFNDRAGYDTYAVDPTHLEVIGFLKTVISGSATVDWTD